MQPTNRTLFAIALTLLVAGTAASCHHRRFGPADGADVAARRVDHALDHLDASEEQRAQLEPVLLEMAAELLALRPGAERLRTVALAQWNAETPDVATVHQQLDAELDTLRLTLHRLVNQAATVHGALTPEQREEIAATAERHRRWRH